MATRAIIKIQGIAFAQVYKHYDGYPEGTLQWLQEFNEDFVRGRGIDGAYKLAQLLRSSATMAEEYGLDKSKYTGWGVEPLGTDCGQEYEYTLHKNGKVTYKHLLDD